VNRRAIGCGALAIVAFLAVGLWGMSKAFDRLEGCPDRLQWGDRVYLPAGSARPQPSFAEGSAVEIGSTFIGLTTRKVWGPPGSEPSSSAGDRPRLIYLDCDDGSVLLFAAESPEP
jgi:hypothetical protein